MNYGKEIAEIEEIDETPYRLVNIKDEVKICVGMNIVSSRKFKNNDEAKKYIKTKPWELMLNTNMLLFEKLYEDKENNKTNK